MAAIADLPSFIARWQGSTLTERSAAQSHFIELCQVLGEQTPATADPSGSFFTFEKGAKKVGGGGGWADVWKRDYFGWEYKGQRKNLDAAYQQLLQYREDLENPPLLVVCDLNRFEVHTNFTGTVKKIYAFTLADLANPAPTPTCDRPPLEVMRAVFTAPASLRPERTSAHVTERAAAEFAHLAESLRQRGTDPEQAAHFLMRLLFCLFAEDIGLLSAGLFSQLIERTRTRPADFAQRLRLLFAAMSTGGAFGVEDIAHFNGGLFVDDEVLSLTAQDLETLSRASRLDWASIEPAIFGTLFERSLDPAKRSQLGAHYTSREDILLIVEPVLMVPLRRRWAKVQEQAQALIAKRDAATGAARTRYQQDVQRTLRDFADEIAGVRVLDPACGSGNFLYVALKLLLDLWKEVNTFGTTHEVPGMLPYGVGPAQMHGIELNVYAHQLASVVVWIGYIQWLHDNGFGVPDSPILQPLHNIQQMDAVLAFDEAGRPVEPPWPIADVIVGNPPFLGGSKLRRELGDNYVEQLWRLYAERVPGGADLVCYWFERARMLITTGQAKRAGLLATNSIRGGLNRRVLEHIQNDGDIFMAWSNRSWVLDGAAVRVSMVGFDAGAEQERMLDGLVVHAINSDLTAQVDVSRAFSLQENERICFRSDEKGGPFDIPPDLASQMVHALLNPNGRPNTDVVRPYINGLDVMRRSRGMWIIDFGVDMPLEQAALYERPFQYVEQTVRPVRELVRNDNERAAWWLHRRPAPDMRRAVEVLSRFIATPRVAKHRVFVWIPRDVIPDCQLYIFAREDDYFLGVLHSKVHELWTLRTCTTLEDRPRYTPTTTFEAFPFAWPPGQEPTGDPRVEAIAAAARTLVERRDAWLKPSGTTEADLKKRTLTNLYNERPTWLQLDHQALDRAVLDAYGWESNVTDEQILERLLALNVRRVKGMVPAL